MAKRNNPALEKAKVARQQDPEGYHAWLIGKGYSPAKAMQKVAEKFGQVEQERQPRTGWAWKD